MKGVSNLMTTSPSIIPRLEVAEKPVETNTSLNKCSPLPLHREDGAFLSLAELRRQYVVDVAVSVCHIRELVMLEAGI